MENTYLFIGEFAIFRLLTLSHRHSQKRFVIDVCLVNLLVESTRRKSHTAHLRFLNQY